MNRSILLAIACSSIGYSQVVLSGSARIAGKAAFVPPVSVDCTFSACPEISPHDSNLNLTFDPYATAGGFAGYADPTIRQDPQTGTLWQAVSYVYTKTGQTHVIETHVYYSMDNGKTWTNSGLAHGGVVNPSLQVCNATTHPGGCMVPSDYDSSVFEVTNLLPVVSGGTTYWFMTGQSYWVPYGCGTSCGTTAQPYTVRFYLVSAATTDPGQGPMALFGATPYYMGSSDNTDGNFPINADFSSLAGSNCTTPPFREPSMNTNGTTTDLYFNTSCGDLSNVMQFHTSISFPTLTFSFTYVNKFALPADAAGICAFVNGCAYTSPNRLRFTQSDQASCQENSTCMIASVVRIDNTGNKISLGCVAVPFTTVTPPVLSTASGHLNVIGTVMSTDSVVQGAGSCTYDPNDVGGIEIAHKITNCVGGVTAGCGTQNGLFTYPMESHILGQPFSSPISNNFCQPASSQLPPLPAGLSLPALPNSCTVPTFPTTSSSVTVTNSADLQTALTNATCGQWIKLQNGTTFTGNFTVPGLACTITNPVLVSQANVANLQQFVPPSQALAGTSGMATLASNTSTATIKISDGAAYWYFAGLEFTVTSSATGIHPIVAMGETTTTIAALPANITFDRVLIHPAPCPSDSVGSPCHYVGRGIDLNAVNGTVMFSQIYGIVNVGQDAQAINVANTVGPGLILGNYLEATGENFIFNTSCTLPTTTGNAPNGAPWGAQFWTAGDDGIPSCPTPADFTIRLNHTKKLLTWQSLPSGCVFASSQCYDVKNHWEVKHGERILIDSNIGDTTYAGGQSNFWILNCFAAGLYVCRDITITNNLIEHGPGIASNSGNGWTNTNGLSGITTGTRVLVRNNLAVDIDGVVYGGPNCTMSAPYSGCASGQTYQTQHSYSYTLDHNTSINEPSQFPNGIAYTDFGPETDFEYTLRNNLQWGSPFANAKSPGGTIAAFPDALWGADIFVGDYWGYPTRFSATNTPVYPAGIQSFSSPAVSIPGTPNITCQNVNSDIHGCWPLDWALVNMLDFTGAANGANLAGAALSSSSPFHLAGTDGADVGANITAVMQAILPITW